MYIYVMIKIKNIKELIKSSGMTMTFVMKKMGISRRTFYIRLDNEEFTQYEFFMLRDLGIV